MNGCGDIDAKAAGSQQPRESETRNGQAREAALKAIESISIEATSRVSYRSRGSLLIMGELGQAVGIGQALHEKLRCHVLATGAECAEEKTAMPVLFSHGQDVRVTGHLGEFTVTMLMENREVNIAEAMDSGRQYFDLMLDLGTTPLLTMEVLPFGYYAPRDDTHLLTQIVTELPAMAGEFEKARYFHYNPDICAHGSSGLGGCSRCLDACPTGAITSLVDKVAVDPYYCQGGGSCATACPTGAIIYSFPKPADAVNRLRILLRTYRENGGCDPVLLIHDDEAGRERVVRLKARMPTHVIPLPVEEIGSMGMDVWFSALAFGAARLVILDTAQVPTRVRHELNTQLGYSHALLEAMGYPVTALALVQPADDEALLTALNQGNRMSPLTAAGFAGSNEKRRAIFHALDHLRTQAPEPVAAVDLPGGAPFGEIVVDRNACTLCMACVSVCPASALYDGTEAPRLDFLEANCVQCGLCERACPESAIVRRERFLFDPHTRSQKRLLNEEEPFLCIACGTPFASKSMIMTMEAKVRGHWMFQDEAALKRLRMCADCRVREMFKADAEQWQEM